MMERAYKKMNAEDTMDQRIKETTTWNASKTGGPGNKRNRSNTQQLAANGGKAYPDQKKIFYELKNKGVLATPKPMDIRTQEWRNNGKYCEYHQDQGHTTEECKSLAREIKRHQKLPDPPKNQQNLKGTVFMISGGDNNKRKEASPEIFSINKKRKEIIYFSDEDLEGINFPHPDPLVISPIINEFRVQRVLVDTGASIDVIYWDAFKNLGLEENQSIPENTPIKGFG